MVLATRMSRHAMDAHFLPNSLKITALQMPNFHFLAESLVGEQGLCSGESIRLLSVWVGFESLSLNHKLS